MGYNPDTPGPAPVITPSPAPPAPNHDWDQAPPPAPFQPPEQRREWENPNIPIVGPVPLPQPPPPPPAARGGERAWQLVTQRNQFSSDEEYYRWILGLPEDPTDSAYNDALLSQKQTARDALRKLGNPEAGHGSRGVDVGGTGWAGKAPAPVVNPFAPGENDETQGLIKARNKGNWLKSQKGQDFVSRPLVLDAYGNPVDTPNMSAKGKYRAGNSQTAQQTDGQPGTGGSEDDGDVTDSSEVDSKTLTGTGKYVWMGKTSVKGPYGAQVEQDTYMSADDLMLQPGKWSPAAVAAFQQKAGLHPTGFVDSNTLKAWSGVVQTAAYYTAAGQHVSPDWVLAQMTGKTNGGAGGGRGRGGGHGSGGGPGGGGGVSVSQAKQALNQYMQKYVGREASDAEAADFTAAFNRAAVSGGRGFDPQQFAIDWIKGRMGGEQGAYQAATDYYGAMMQVLGGRM